MRRSFDRTQRLGIIVDVPYGLAIKNAELRVLVYDAWAMSLSSSSFERTNDRPCSAYPGGRT